MQALLTGTKLGSATADTAQMITKYAAPASIPQINRWLAAPFEKKSPASSEDTQYITIILISTIFSPIENLYSNPATNINSTPVIRYAAIRHFRSATKRSVLNALFKIHYLPFFQI